MGQGQVGGLPGRPVECSGASQLTPTRILWQRARKHYSCWANSIYNLALLAEGWRQYLHFGKPAGCSCTCRWRLGLGCFCCCCQDAMKRVWRGEQQLATIEGRMLSGVKRGRTANLVCLRTLLFVPDITYKIKMFLYVKLSVTNYIALRIYCITSFNTSIIQFGLYMADKFLVS